VVKYYASRNQIPLYFGYVDDLNFYFQIHLSDSASRLYKRIKIEHELLDEVIHFKFHDDRNQIQTYLEERWDIVHHPEDAKCTEEVITKLVNARNPDVYLKQSFDEAIVSKCNVFFPYHWGSLIRLSKHILELFLQYVDSKLSSHSTTADDSDVDSI
jgi:hypothetical protein